MTNLSILEHKLAKLISHNLEHDGGEMSPNGFYFIPLQSFALDLCNLLTEQDSAFDEKEFLSEIGFEKLTVISLINKK